MTIVPDIPTEIDDILTDWYASRLAEQGSGEVDRVRNEHDTLMAWVNGLVSYKDTATIAYMLGYEHGKDYERSRQAAVAEVMTA